MQANKNKHRVPQFVKTKEIVKKLLVNLSVK